MSFRPYFLVIALGLGAGSAWAQSANQVDVFKSPYCGCCGKWAEHLRANGFDVRIHEVTDIPAERQRLGMPNRLGSCHTATVGGYVIEGHVPASDIQRLLKDKPKAIGLAVPSMPPGSPGMESTKPIPFDTLLVQADGSTHVLAHH